jgi:hypothetical protein
MGGHGVHQHELVLAGTVLEVPVGAFVFEQAGDEVEVACLEKFSGTAPSRRETDNP